MAFFISQSLFFIIPLLIVALAGMFSEKSGTVNIALEGIMVIGAFCGIFFLNRMQAAGILSDNKQLLIMLSVFVGGFGGIIFASLLGFLAINMRADQTIGGTALNILAASLAIFLAKTLQSNGAAQIGFDPQGFSLGGKFLRDVFPNINYIFFDRAYITTYFGLLLFGLSTVIIYKTRFGSRLSACGEHPEAAQSVGINVVFYRWAGVLISGFLAGMGGVIYILPISVSFEGTVAGYGFLALAVLIFGQWKPVRILWAAIFFGMFKALSVTFFGMDWVKALSEIWPSFPFGMVFKMLPYLATMVVLAISSKRSFAPKASGKPFIAKGR
ncbi:MAG: ABC transporter permease [Paracholeplasma sp.]|nr:ABC transporter permease [Paracholeplasma sp.]MDY3196449.1 ABC transporter permease [Paracholeplasma sp.]